MRKESTIQSNFSYECVEFVDALCDKNTKNSEFVECNFRSSDFANRNFNECLFENCSFHEMDISLAKLLNSKMIDCSFSGCKLIGIDWALLRKEMGLRIKFHKCDLSFSTFFQVDLSNSEFVECKIKEVLFSDSVLKKVSFSKSDLTKTRFLKCNLERANFRGAHGYFFDLTDNKCKGAQFDVPEVLNLLSKFGVKIV